MKIFELMEILKDLDGEKEVKIYMEYGYGEGMKSEVLGVFMDDDGEVWIEGEEEDEDDDEEGEE